MNILSVLRIGALVLIALIFVKSLLKKKQRVSNDQDLQHFEKNEDGLYPWEINTDDDPKHIPDDAKRFVEKDKIQRGKW